jgi:hypothetical protein
LVLGGKAWINFAWQALRHNGEGRPTAQMSKYSKSPLEFAALRSVTLKERGGKVKAADFASAYQKGSGIAGWLNSLPRILAGESFRAVVEALDAARARHRALIWGLGGHVIKCGLAPVLIDLMQRGYVTLFALNGAAAVHDFEIALAGATSEDVEATLPDGRFGVADETGCEMNCAIAAGERDGLGMGEALGRRLDTLLAGHAVLAGQAVSPAHQPEAGAGSSHAEASLVLQAYRHGTPVTVHVAVGTDTPHVHPSADGAAIGSTTHRDFRLFCAYATDLDDGGVYLNCGSAVVLPEVFLKAISAVRAMGSPLTRFTTVNLDFLEHYRPRANVVERPHARSGGAGYSIRGHHELMLPLLAAALIEKEP